jgi:hypothetical protein
VVGARWTVTRCRFHNQLHGDNGDVLVGRIVPAGIEVLIRLARKRRSELEWLSKAQKARIPAAASRSSFASGHCAVQRSAAQRANATGSAAAPTALRCAALHCTALQGIVAAALVSLGFTPTDWACDVDAADDKVARPSVSLSLCRESVISYPLSLNLCRESVISYPLSLNFLPRFRSRTP